MAGERVPGHADLVNTKEEYDALNINVRVWDANGKLIEFYDEEGQPYELDGNGGVILDGVTYPIDNEGTIDLGVGSGKNYVPPEQE